MAFAFDISRNMVLSIYNNQSDIFILMIENGRIVINEVLCSDYHSGLTAARVDDNIYIAYVTMAGELVAEAISGGERIVLYSDCDNSRRPENISIAAVDNEIIVFYKLGSFDGVTEIRCIAVEKGSSSRLIYSNNTDLQYSLIHEEIGGDGREKSYYIKIIEENDPNIRRFKLIRRDDGIIDWDEFLMVRKETIAELEKKCLINAEECNRKLKAQQRDNDERIKKELKEQEKRFKKQYDQLSEMAKNIQDEGRRWRDLYYRSTNRNIK